MTVSALVSCGSNIDSERNLRAAVELLGSRIPVRAVSRVFVTRAVGGSSAASEFRNAALELETDLSPAFLKYSVLREVEAQLGRRRTEDRNAARPIDLDLSLFGNQIFDNEPLGLSIPDPEILTRIHVAVPLADLAGDRLHPVLGEPLGEIAKRLLAAAPEGQILSVGEL